ncbi:MAG: oligoendopeptidase F family protein [Burkholderiaceae bacterium]|nr:oligoendopeptidase F family protein [Burkholderiaceae bacterium]
MKRWMHWAALVLAAVSLAPTQAAGDAEAVSLNWDLGDLYPSVEAWSAAYAKTRTQAEQLDRLKGSLGGGPAHLLKALSTISQVHQEADRLTTYARLASDEDVRVAATQELNSQAQALQTLIDEKTSWVAPEIIAIGHAKIDACLDASPELRRHFDFFLKDTLRAAPHTLGTEAEAVLAASGNVLAQPNSVFQQLADGELPFPPIELSNVPKVRLDQAAYEKYRSVPSREDRRAVFDAFWGAWKGYQGTLGANLTTQDLGDVFRAKARRFDSSLDAALFSSNLPPEVYRTLVAQANAGLPTLHRYLRLRKRLLGITDDLRYYDNYPTLFPATSVPKFSVAESERITLEALAPMGEEYLGLLRRGFAGKWMSALPHPGKHAGGYMIGRAYAVHPYILLNHNDDYESLSTVAHEWGHAVHTMLTTANQPYEKSRYSTFIAESASIGNEMLLNDYMVSHAKSREEKLFYLGEGLESIRITFFRQVMFAEFQLQMHEELEHGHPLSGEHLTENYCKLLRRYYGEAEDVMKIDPVYCTEWEFIPHFYYGFYVYQYATSMAGAAEFTDAILNEGAPARDRFINMLKAGGSDYPYDLYRRAGIDMATAAPYQALIARMNRVMDQIETELK